jgi:hypothetical protein
VDFQTLKKYLKPDTIRIMELKDSVSADQARLGLAWLATNGF